MNKINNLKETFLKIKEVGIQSEIYFDVNYILKSEKRISIDKVNVSINKDLEEGIKIRAWDGEKFIERATTSLDETELLREVKELFSIAKNNFLENQNAKKLDFEQEEIVKDFIIKAKQDSKLVKLEDLTKKVEEMKEEVLKYENIVNVRALFLEELEENLFCNPKRLLFQSIPSCTLVKVAFVNCADSNTRMVYKSYVDNGLEVFDKEKSEIEEFKKNIKNIYTAKKLNGGKYKVVLSPMLTGLLAHESFGHGMEADTMMKDRALASKWQDKKIGSDMVSIVDYPAIEGKHGEFYFDHEGNLARKTYLVKNGVVNEPMADLYSKNKLGLANSSNARFESFDHKHYTRMSNTYFEPGESSIEELISNVEEGIFVYESHGGMEDPKGWGVQLQGCVGQVIKNGKLIDEFYDGFSLTGFLPDIMKNVEGVSKEFEIEGGGMCGKGHKEWVRVSEGGPYMLINGVILG